MVVTDVARNRRRLWLLSPSTGLPQWAQPGLGRRGGGASPGAAQVPHLAQRPEARANLVCEEVRLFPRREVPAPGDLVVVDEVRVGPLRPTPRGLILLAGKDAHGRRDGDTFGIEETALVFPIETRRRDPRVRQPIERDVVEDLVARQLARGARGPGQRRGDRRGRLAIS